MAKRKTSKQVARTKDAAVKTLRELAEEIAGKRDLAGVGEELLKADSESVKARVWETLANWAYGKPPAGNGSGAGAPAVRVIWDIPRPPHEKPTDE